MIISVVIPAYNASSTICRTLDSIFTPSLPQDWALDIIVINDGSDDAAELSSNVSSYSDVSLLGYSVNRGKSSAMNLGISETKGDIIIILDADDELVPEWPQTLLDIAEEWPASAQICFAACHTQFGETTLEEPDYSGPLTFEDMLNDRYIGEYLPMFRGDSLRAAGGYMDPKTSWCCPQWTYLEFAKREPIWITREVMRIYYVDQENSACGSLGKPDRAMEIVHCYDLIFDSFGTDYKRLARSSLRKRRLRQAVFAAIGRKRLKALMLWSNGVTFRAPLESMAALFLIVIGGAAAFKLVNLAKKVRLIRQYG